MRYLRCVPLLFIAAFLALPSLAHAQSTQPSPRPDIGGLPSTETTGILRGIVRFNGERRPPRPLDVTMDKHCAANAKPLLSESYVWGDGDTLQNVLVYVSGGLTVFNFLESKKPSVTLDQNGCRFVPHVVTLRTGQPLVLRNGDDTLHNIRSLAKNNETFNLGQPTQGHRHEVTFKKAEIGVPIKCDVHPWMSAFVHVFDHPFYALTQQAGTFEIQGLDPCEYEISTWHELPAFKPDQPVYRVKIEAGKTTELTITYSPRGSSKSPAPNESGATQRAR